MKGKILGFDAAAGTGAITGEDGNRYKFEASEWRSPRPARPGEEVDFELNAEGKAGEIYPLKASAGLDLNDVRDRMKGDLGEMSAKAKQMFEAGAASPAGGQALAILSTRLNAVLAVIILLASIVLSFVAIGADGVLSSNSPLGTRTGYSAIGIFGFTSKVTDNLRTFSSSVDNMGESLSMLPASVRDAVETMRSAASSAKFAAHLLYIAFLIPLGAAGFLYLEWTGKADKRAALGLGALCVVAFVVTLYLHHAFAGVFESILGMGQQFGGPSTSELSKVEAAYPGASLGAYIILLCGIGLIANALGYVRLPAPASARA